MTDSASAVDIKKMVNGFIMRAEQSLAKCARGMENSPPHNAVFLNTLTDACRHIFADIRKTPTSNMFWTMHAASFGNEDAFLSWVSARVALRAFNLPSLPAAIPARPGAPLPAGARKPFGKKQKQGIPRVNYWAPGDDSSGETQPLPRIYWSPD